MAGGNPQPFVAAARRYGQDPGFDAWSRKQYGISGPALLAKVSKGESNNNMAAVSSAGARGGTQFMPGTRADFLKRYGVDAWKNPDSAVHATELFLKNNPRGLAGYNPGMASYPGYILDQKVGDVSHGGVPGATPSTTRTTTTPGVDNSGARAQLISRFLSQNKPDVLGFALSARALQDTPGTTKTTSSPSKAVTGGAGGSQALPTARVKARAAAIDKQHLPYKWGGGHGTQIAGPGVPLDCSGAVSKVLGVTPRVSGQFESFGHPGPGKRVTIYAKGSHVLVEVDGRLWGTSSSNPGGGAGWIDKANVPAGYLSGFVVRHPAGA